MEEPVTIVDRDVLKALSADTRMDILKELSEGNRTPSDLGKKLKKSDATIVEHLEGLRKVGLVTKIEQPGKKWIFYTLTERGYGIVSSKKRRLVIILSTSLLALVGSSISFGKYFFQPTFFGEMLAKSPQTEEVVRDTAITANTFYLYLGIGLAVVGIVVLGFYLYKKLKSNGRKLHEGF